MVMMSYLLCVVFLGVGNWRLGNIISSRKRSVYVLGFRGEFCEKCKNLLKILKIIIIDYVNIVLV